MRLKEALHFNKKDYKTRMKQKDYTFGELAVDIYQKRRRIASSKVSIGTGVACAHLTGGTSLLSSAYAGRNISVEKQKLALLEDRWASTGIDPLPKRPIKDTLIPIVISTAIGAFAFSVDLAISNAVATAADAAQLGLSGYALPVSSHLISGEYGGVEKGMNWASGHVNNQISKMGGLSFNEIKISDWMREQGLGQDGEYEDGEYEDGSDGAEEDEDEEEDEEEEEEEDVTASEEEDNNWNREASEDEEDEDGRWSQGEDEEDDDY
ncbi:hypothetical protein PILCRDRAFT_3526 [Piloderma croceum F 1598]|uniref:Uncharacterized protein n=1 Tax=Piloderma croceum (strain F 1598) TaxID=765440 RepID=A0A0C3GAW5_PILCF|nr:hypothetical protein PILCRDRAFT_3526 [Piloderma croceum F 1598]